MPHTMRGMPDTATKFGRHQVVEPLENLAFLHLHDYATTLKEVVHEPRVGVLDQEDLLAQGIDTSQIVSGAEKVDALGSCTANATTAKLSSFLTPEQFWAFVTQMVGPASYEPNFSDVVTAEKAAIVFYHRCTDQTGRNDEEWPPTDCGSSGPYIVELLKAMKLCSGAKIASGATNIVSLLQQGSLLVGLPFMNDWMNPDASGFIGGDGSNTTIQDQINDGVAGGHEMLVWAIRKLVVLPNGQVDPHHTVLQIRNSWSRSWAESGDCLIYLSWFVALAGQCDWRLLTK